MTISVLLIGGSIILIIGLALLAASAVMTFMMAFIIASIIIGVGFGTTFMGSTGELMAVVPAEKKGETISFYFVIAYIGTSIPIFAVSVLPGAVGTVNSFSIFTSILVLGLMISIELFSRHVNNA